MSDHSSASQGTQSTLWRLSWEDHYIITPEQGFRGQCVQFYLNHNSAFKITSLAIEISLPWLLSQFSSWHSKNKLNENVWDCCYRVFSGKQTFSIRIVIKLSRKTGMCPTLWMYVDKGKEEIVRKEWKQIKIELTSTFQTFFSDGICNQMQVFSSSWGINDLKISYMCKYKRQYLHKIKISSNI